MRTICAALLSALALSACGGSGPVVQDGSGNRVVFGAHPHPMVGPGSPGWPMPTPAQAGR